MKKLIAKMLRIAAEEFSNHGCNDFNLETDGGLSKEEAQEALRKMYEDGFLDEKETNPNQLDWNIMDWLAAVIEKDFQS